MLAIKVPGFDTCGGRAILAMHEFHITESDVSVRVDLTDPDKGEEIINRGMLVHITDGVRRATVPPSSWDDYAYEWPAIKPLIESARNSFQRRKRDAANDAIYGDS